MSLDETLSSKKARLKSGVRTQAAALFYKNAVQQRRAWATNCFIIVTPVLVCVFLVLLQTAINHAFSGAEYRCGCRCVTCCPEAGPRTNCSTPTGFQCAEDEICTHHDHTMCGLQYSSSKQAGFCEISTPSMWPALMKVPSAAYRAEPWAPAAAMLTTGNNQTLAKQLSARLFKNVAPTAGQRDAATKLARQGLASGAIYAGALSLLDVTLGTFFDERFSNYFLDPAFRSTVSYNGSLFLMVKNETDPLTRAAVNSLNMSGSALYSQFISEPIVVPVTSLPVAMDGPDAINSALYCGYRQARCNGTYGTNGFAQAWDWQDTSIEEGRYNVRMWYNVTGRYGNIGQLPPANMRVNQGINRATNAFLKRALGDKYSAILVGIMGMPKPESRLTLDFGTLLGPLFYTWLFQLLLPVMLVTLVYEKERRLRTIMKMHGLGDGVYWAVQLSWFFTLSLVYTWVLIGLGSAIQLSFFIQTSYSFMFVFFMLWSVCLIAFAFVLSTLFFDTRTALISSFLYVFASGLLGFLVIEQFVSTGKWWIVFLEIVPGFGLYRALFAISQWAFKASWQGTQGVTWSDLSATGIDWVMIIFAIEFVVFLVLAWYLEQVMFSGIGTPRHPLFFLGFKGPRRKLFKCKLGCKLGSCLHKKKKSTSDSKDHVIELEMDDVAQERERVEQMMARGETAPIIIRDLRKTFPSQDGNKEKAAVRGLTLAVNRGECFGLLGPNGAGKSTSLNILTGFLSPSSGTALVEGLDITRDMPDIYSIMGVCPQHDLLWDQLTGREHLTFYGQLKNLKGQELLDAVDSSLRSVNLFANGVSNRQVRRYSGGMKRRLSVAISFIGGPPVVYLDEPSSGLDPASRQNLWDVVKQAKEDRGIILTTHSMEEAEVLCDRIGIFVDGQLVCIGNPKELTSRYGSHHVFTITVPHGQEGQAETLVKSMSPNARLTYSLAGTQKFELPVADVTIGGVFAAMTTAPQGLVIDWGVANATLEEVFLDFASKVGAKAAD